MSRAAVEARPQAVRVLCREHESEKGCSDICQAADGSRFLRFQVRDPVCQEECITHLAPDTSVESDVEWLVLELRSAYRDGISLKQWIYEQDPELGQRRDVCLFVLTHIMEDRAPLELIKLSARDDCLRFSATDAWLIYLPDWNMWCKGLKLADAVNAVAKLCLSILTRGVDAVTMRLLPVELELIRRRCGCGGYLSWDALFRDLAALPDMFPTVEQICVNAVQGVERAVRPYRKIAAYLAAIALVVAAVLSVWSAARVWQGRRNALFQGIQTIGTQELGQDRGGNRS